MDDASTAASEAAGPANSYAHLPEHIRLEDTITSTDVSEHPPVQDAASRERSWLIRNVGIGG